MNALRQSMPLGALDSMLHAALARVGVDRARMQ